MFNRCDTCPRGRFGTTGGSVPTSLDTGCETCTIGRFSDVEALSSKDTDDEHCSPCPPGRWNDGIGQKKESLCKFCKSGRYSSTPASSTKDNCKPCSAGKYLATVGESTETACKSCLVGFSQKATGKAYCLPCMLGEYMNAVGASACNKCPAGRFRNDLPATVCVDCPKKGQHQNNGTFCLGCAVGTYEVNSNHDVYTCQKCPSGFSTYERDQIQCQSCLVGKTTQLKEGATECLKCSMGQHWQNITHCKTCQEGRYNNDDGAKGCKPCAVGKHSNAQRTDCNTPPWKTVVDCDSENQYLNASDPDPMFHVCLPCPLGASCKGFIAWNNVTAKYGWWRRNVAVDQTTPPLCLSFHDGTRPPCAFEKCLYPHACHGAANPDKYTDSKGKDVADFDRVERCDEETGYSNNCTDEHGKTNVRCRLCGTCLQNYKRSGRGTQCKLCPPPEVNQWLLAVGFLGETFFF